VLIYRLKAMAASSHPRRALPTEHAADQFLRQLGGPGSMTLRRWFDYQPISFSTIVDALRAVRTTVEDMAVLRAASLVAADRPPSPARPDDFRMELRPTDVDQLDAMLDRFERALGGDDEAAFVQQLADERSDALREASELNFFREALAASRITAIWEQVGLWLTIFLGVYQAALLLFHLTSAKEVAYTGLPLVFALYLLLSLRSTEREPLGITLEWARRWVDPRRQVRQWTATYRMIVPALMGMIVLTVVDLLLWR